jgi:hypothetical protein
VLPCCYRPETSSIQDRHEIDRANRPAAAPGGADWRSGMSGTRKITRSPAHPQAQLDAAVEPAVERAAAAGLRYEPMAEPEINRRARTTDSRPAGELEAIEASHRHDGEMNRSERIGFWIYVAMGILCAAVVVAAAISAIAS